MAFVIRVVVGVVTGVVVIVAALTSSQPALMLLGCAVLAGTVLLIVLEAANARILNRRELDTGLLTLEALTYTPVGGTVDGTSPRGFRYSEASAVIGRGREAFERAADAVLRWEVKTRSGFRVIRVGPEGSFFSNDPVTEGECAVIRIGPVRETVRVVRVIAEARRRGFVYGTLPRHPLRGEEAFIVVWRDDEAVELRVRSFSRPGWLRPLQGFFRRRYLRALLD